MKKTIYLLMLTLVFSCSEENIMLETQKNEVQTIQVDLPEVLDYLDYGEQMFAFDSFEELDKVSDILMSGNDIESYELMSNLFLDHEIEIQYIHHVGERMDLKIGKLSKEELKFSEVDIDDKLHVKDYNIYWAISNQNNMFKVGEIYYYIDSPKMYSAETKEEILQAIEEPSYKSKLFDNKLGIEIDDQKSLSGTLWTCNRSVALGQVVTEVCVERTCCVICSSGCNIVVVGCPGNRGCFLSFPCEFETVTQDFSGRSYWYTFRTYYCGWYCPYMNYHVRANHRWESSLPNANLSSSYSYRLNGTTYTLSGTGNQVVSRSLTHNLGLIGTNESDYQPNISHVSANCTGTAQNGQNVVCN